MKLKKSLIGSVIKVKDKYPVTIEDNADKFPLYKKLGLDVFEVEKKPTKKSDKAN